MSALSERPAGYGRTRPTPSARATTPEAIAGPFLRVARRYSLREDDAWDALAFGFEITLRHRHRIRPESAGAWFAVVVRHEALRIRRGRLRELPLDRERLEPAIEPEAERALLLFYAMDGGHADGGR